LVGWDSGSQERFLHASLHALHQRLGLWKAAKSQQCMPTTTPRGPSERKNFPTGTGRLFGLQSLGRRLGSRPARSVLCLLLGRGLLRRGSGCTRGRGLLRRGRGVSRGRCVLRSHALLLRGLVRHLVEQRTTATDRRRIVCLWL